jgi:hypothetical protein
MNETKETVNPKTNPDPITHAPGAHVVGTGVGAAVGGAAGVAGAIATGAVIGSAAGPIGTATGAAIGAVVGGLAGKYVAEDINPTVEETYWRKVYASRPYALDKSYEEYGPAYRYGWETYPHHAGKNFDDMERVLEREWDHVKGTSKLLWLDAKLATRDAWDRLKAMHHKS